jgi:predicted anti-sigma-YlaC factor YlaD
MASKVEIWMASKMMDCDQATSLINKRDQEKLSCRQRFSLRVHLMTCSLCRNYEKQILSINKNILRFKEALENDEVVFTLPPKQKEEMKQCLQEEEV